MQAPPDADPGLGLFSSLPPDLIDIIFCQVLPLSATAATSPAETRWVHAAACNALKLCSKSMRDEVQRHVLREVRRLTVAGETFHVAPLHFAPFGASALAGLLGSRTPFPAIASIDLRTPTPGLTPRLRPGLDEVALARAFRTYTFRQGKRQPPLPVGALAVSDIDIGCTPGLFDALLLYTDPAPPVYTAEDAAATAPPTASLMPPVHMSSASVHALLFSPQRGSPPFLTSLTLEGCRIKAPAFEAMASTGIITRLLHLSLMGSAVPIHHMANALHLATQILSINLSHIPLSGAGLRQSLAPGMTRLQSLKVSGCRAHIRSSVRGDGDDALLFVRTVRYFTSLKELDISSNYLRTDNHEGLVCMRLLGVAITDMTRLVSLDISDTDITSTGLVQLFQTMAPTVVCPPSLQRLALRNCTLGSSTAEYVAHFLETATDLKAYPPPPRPPGLPHAMACRSH